MAAEDRKELEILRDLQSARAAGDASGELTALRNLKGYRSMQAVRQGRRELNESMSPGQVALVGVGRGFYDIGTGVAQRALQAGEALGIADPETRQRLEQSQNDQLGIFEDLQEDRPVPAVGGRILGNVAASSPVALLPGGQAAALGTRSAALGVQGGVAGAAQFTPEDGSLLGQVAFGLGAGALAPALLQGIQRSGNAVIGRAVGALKRARLRSAVDDAGNLSDDAVRALQREGINPAELTDEMNRELARLRSNQMTAEALTPDEQVRAARMQAEGIEPTKGQVTQKFQDQQLERELLKDAEVGGPLRDRFAAQNRRLQERPDELMAQLGATAEDQVETGQRVAGAVQTKADELQEGVRSKFAAARAAATDDPLDADLFSGRAIEVMEDFEGEFPAAIEKRVRAFINGERDFTIGEADKLRKLVNGPANTPRQKAAMSALRSVLDDTEEAFTAIDEDVVGLFRQARQAASERFKEVLPDQKSLAAIRKLTQGEIPPDAVFDRFILRSTDEELRALKGILTRGTPEQVTRGRQALADMKGETVRYALGKALGRTGERTELGDLMFSGAQFNKALERIGERRLKTIFEPHELAAIKQFSEAARDVTVPIAGSVNFSNTGSAMVNAFKRMFRAVPVLGEAMERMQRNARAAEAGVQLREALQATTAISKSRALERSVRVDEFLREVAPAIGLTSAQSAVQGSRELEPEL